MSRLNDSPDPRSLTPGVMFHEEPIIRASGGAPNLPGIRPRTPLTPLAHHCAGLCNRPYVGAGCSNGSAKGASGDATQRPVGHPQRWPLYFWRLRGPAQVGQCRHRKHPACRAPVDGALRVGEPAVHPVRSVHRACCCADWPFPLIGLPWMILATTFLTSVFVFALSSSPSLATDMANQNNVGSLVAFLIEQWVLAIIVFAVATGYRRILRQISDIRVQYERARQLDELKDQFITTVNHELRNPVMLMQGYIELLRIKGETLPPERRNAMIQSASRAGDNLVQLVKSILDTRRIDQGAKDFEPEVVPVFDAVATSASLVEPGNEHETERELRVHIPEGVALWGEKVRVQQILTNLLSNAVKYSPPGTPVEVVAKVVSPPASGSLWNRRKHTGRRMVQISVRVHGLGIPPDQAPLLFHRFARLPRDLASTTTGNGLGLYLSRELAEAMGGSLWFESTGVEGEGTTFYLEAPLPPDTSIPRAGASELDDGRVHTESMPLRAVKPPQSAQQPQPTTQEAHHG